MTNTSQRIALAIGAALMALGVAAGVYASTQNTNPPPPPFMGGRQGPGGPGMGPLGPLGMIASQLGLSDTQKDQIKSVVESHGSELRDLADRARTAHRALAAAEMADTVDDAAIRAASAQVAAVDADMAVARAHIRAEIFQVLTPEQQAKARELLGRGLERAERMRQRFQQKRDGQ